MNQLTLNSIILGILLCIVIYIHYYGYKPNYEYFYNINNFAPIPFIYKPQIHFFEDLPTGYDSGSRNYTNPYFAQQVAQGLDTN